MLGVLTPQPTVNVTDNLNKYRNELIKHAIKWEITEIGN